MGGVSTVDTEFKYCSIIPDKFYVIEESSTLTIRQCTLSLCLFFFWKVHEIPYMNMNITGANIQLSPCLKTVKKTIRQSRILK